MIFLKKDEGWSNSTVGKMPALPMADLHLILGTTYDPPSTARSDIWTVRSKPWAQPGIVQNKQTDPGSMSITIYDPLSTAVGNPWTHSQQKALSQAFPFIVP